MSTEDAVKRRVLLVIHVNTYFVGLLPVARLLKASEIYEPVFLFAQIYPTIAADTATCDSEAIPYLTMTTKLSARQTGPISADKGRPTLKSHIKRWLEFMPKPLQQMVRWVWRRTWHITIDNVFSHLWLLSKEIGSVRQLIQEQNAVLLVVPADNRYDIACFVKAAHQEQIPAVAIPSFMASALEWAEFVMNVPMYSLKKWSNRVVGMLYPRWIYRHKRRKLLALPASQVLAREWLRIAPPLPWVLHSGYTDAIAVESEAVRSYCASEGLPINKLVVTGSVAHDVLAEALKQAHQRRSDLCDKLKLPCDRPMILSALPPDSLYMTGGRPECEFQKYDELVEFWVRSLTAIKGHNIVLCLHPSVSYEEMRYIEEWGVRIARESTVRLIPLCDIFVAAISATIQWAIACAKPVINYDVYRYGYQDYASATGVIRVDGKEEFLAVLQRITEDRAYYDELVGHQVACAGQWGQLDGRAGQRLLQLFDRLVDENMHTGGPRCKLEQTAESAQDS